MSLGLPQREGERACPPEEVGGPPGYANFLEAIRHPPTGPSRTRGVSPLGRGAFDPEGFDDNSVNRVLRA
ncbi:MAG: IS1096 element passenger TnpR family protein [Sulfuricaulis sp.]